MAHYRTFSELGVRMKQYPWGTRLLFWAHHLTGKGVQELYEVVPLRWFITLLDNLTGKPPTWPR